MIINYAQRPLCHETGLVDARLYLANYPFMAIPKDLKVNGFTQISKAAISFKGYDEIILDSNPQMKTSAQGSTDKIIVSESSALGYFIHLFVILGHKEGLPIVRVRQPIAAAVVHNTDDIYVAFNATQDGFFNRLFKPKPPQEVIKINKATFNILYSAGLEA